MITHWFNRLWYEFKYPYFGGVLRAFAALFAFVAYLRRQLYRYRFIKVFKPAVPVIIVGNLSVGGTGKTPLVIYLAQLLKQQGYQPGIISRGYGGRAKQYPLRVDVNTDPLLCGDEPALIALRSQCPVVVDPQRVRAVNYLLNHTACNVLISDDGLQHYALGRDLEIVVIDGYRRFGNKRLLPAGPLREPLSRLENVDFVVNNGGAHVGEVSMRLQFSEPYHLQSKKTRTLGNFLEQTIHAVAAIGNPQRFFQQLRAAGLTIIEHPFADHHCFTPADLAFNTEDVIIMTEKDAVKCRHFTQQNIWVIPITAQLDAEFPQQLLAKLKALIL